MFVEQYISLFVYFNLQSIRDDRIWDINKSTAVYHYIQTPARKIRLFSNNHKFLTNVLKMIMRF